MSTASLEVLVADDDPGVSSLVSDILVKQGHRVGLAATARECFERLRRARPQVLLLDVMLPDMSGLDALGRLRSDPAAGRLPVVVMSTVTDKAFRQRALESGADAFLAKPFTPLELMEALWQALGHSGAAGGPSAG